MPCNGVAVANGRVNSDLAQFIEQVDNEALGQAVTALLQNQFAHLGQPEEQQLYRRHGRGQVAGVSFILGDRYLINIQDGRVIVNTQGWAGPEEEQIVEQLKDALTGLLDGLGGLMLQQQLVRQIKSAGYQITGETRAPNGAIVLNVEV